MPEDLNSLRKKIRELEAKVPFPEVKAIKTSAELKTGEFRKALVKLSSDPEYRKKATKDPSLVTSDFKLTLSELQSLRSVAIMSGADVRVVSKYRVNQILDFEKGADSWDVDVSCCSCCCCCCGETAVEAF